MPWSITSLVTSAISGAVRIAGTTNANRLEYLIQAAPGSVPVLETPATGREVVTPGTPFEIEVPVANGDWRVDARAVAVDLDSLFEQIIGLRTQTTPNGRTSTNTLKVPGVDTMPTGWSIVGATVRIDTPFAGDIEDWDFTDRMLEIRTSIGHIRNNLFGQTAPLFWYYINFLVAGAAVSCQYNTFTGMSNHQGVGSAMNFSHSGSGMDTIISECPLIARNRFLFLTADAIKILGTKTHASQVIEWNYFGVPVNVPQQEPLVWDEAVTYAEGDYAKDLTRNTRGMISKVNGNIGNLVPTGAVSNDFWQVLDPHADAITTVAAFTRLDIRRNLFDWLTPVGVFNQGLTNALRYSRNTGSTHGFEEVNSEENIILWELTSSLPIQVQEGTGVNFNGPVRFIDNWLSPRDGNVYFHPTTNGLVDVWTGNIDATTLVPVTGPTLRVRTVPVFTVQPAAVTVTEGGLVEFTVAFTGNPIPNGIWQVNTGSGYVNMTGQTGTVLTFTSSADQSGNLYRHVATNTEGTATSEAVLLTVNAATPSTVSALVLGQSELEYLFNTSSFYRTISQPTPGDGNLIVYTQNGNGVAPVKTTVNATTVAEGSVNPAMAAMSAFLEYALPNTTFVIGDAAVAGTGRGSLVDDANTDRLWSDVQAVIDDIETDYTSVNVMIECWYNSDAGYINTFKTAFWPHYFGTDAAGSTFTLGATHSGADVDHCFWDGDAATNVVGRGVFARDTTKWHILTPMPFLDGPVDPDPEQSNFSTPSARMMEPRRQTMIGLESDTLAQSVGLQVKFSAHVTDFAGGIHPVVDDPDGQILLMYPIAFAMLDAAGYSISEPTIHSVESPEDGTHAEILVNLPNGGNLTTVRQSRAEAMPGTPSPHQQLVTGIELTRGGTRRPVFNESETSYPVAYRGTITIVDTGSGSPRRGRVRITPETPFQFGDSVSYLRGQTTAVLLEPRDITNQLFKDMLIEHVPALYDATATYPCDGIPVQPYQTELLIPVDENSFDPQSTRFNGTSSRLQSSSLSFAGSNALTFSVWLYYDSATWSSATGQLLSLRTSGGSTRFSAITSSSGRITFAIAGAASFTVPTSTFTTQTWHHLAVSVNANAGGSSRYQVYVDGVEVGGTKPDVSAINLTMHDETLARAYVGSSAETQVWTGDIGHLWMALGVSLDLSESSVMSAFLDGNSPADVGGTGQTPTGSTPTIYINGGASPVNLGTAGGLTATALVSGGTPLLT
jgi:hypothetical protein